MIIEIRAWSNVDGKYEDHERHLRSLVAKLVTTWPGAQDPADACDLTDDERALLTALIGGDA